MEKKQKRTRKVAATADAGIITEAHKYSYCQKTLEMEQGARLLYLILGERLYNIREERLYEPSWDSWHTFTMEFKDMSPSSISKMIKVHEKLVLELGFTHEELAKAGGWTKLYEILKVVTSKEDAEKWLTLAETTSRQDFGKYMIEAKSGVSMSECKHPNTHTVIVCDDCGESWKSF